VADLASIDQHGFWSLSAWLEDVRQYARKDVDIMLVGNKADLEHDRKVDFKSAKDYADDHLIPYMEVGVCHYLLCGFSLSLVKGRLGFGSTDQCQDRLQCNSSVHECCIRSTAGKVRTKCVFEALASGLCLSGRFGTSRMAEKDRIDENSGKATGQGYNKVKSTTKIRSLDAPAPSASSSCC